MSSPILSQADLPTDCVQNHAAYLAWLPGGRLGCCWFGGTQEGLSDIGIWFSSLDTRHDAADDVPARWHTAIRLSGDPQRSEQNPVLFVDPDGHVQLFHTAQFAGHQDRCLVRGGVVDSRIGIGAAPAATVGSALPASLPDLALPLGHFVRQPPIVRGDGAWLLPLFHCISGPDGVWNGSHDQAVLAISVDRGETWRRVHVPQSTGCVHMNLIPLGGDRLVALFRRRQADYVYRSESDNGGESWSLPTATDVPNNNSSIQAIRLADGRIAMVCNPVSAAMSGERRESLYDDIADEIDADAAPSEVTGTDAGSPDAGSPDAGSPGIVPVWGVPRAPLSLCLSDDDGVSFTQRIDLVTGPGTCLTNNSRNGSNEELSYPSIVQDPDGSLHVAYTHHRRTIRHLHVALPARH